MNDHAHGRVSGPRVSALVRRGKPFAGVAAGRAMVGGRQSDHAAATPLPMSGQAMIATELSSQLTRPKKVVDEEGSDGGESEGVGDAALTGGSR